MILNQAQLKALQDVVDAFDQVSYPGDDRIANCGRGPGCAECAEIRELFRGQHWRSHVEQPFEFLGRFPPAQPKIRMSRDSICLLDTPAIHYFLPIFLSALMTDPEQADVMYTAVASLFNKPQDNESISLLAAMTVGQRQATASVLCTVNDGGEFSDAIFALDKNRGSKDGEAVNQKPT